jgi:hypothetical protein
MKVGERQKLHVPPKKDAKMQNEALWEQTLCPKPDIDQAQNDVVSKDAC